MRTPTGRLEVEATQLDGVGGVVQRQLLAVGQAAFPRLRLCSFPAKAVINFLVVLGSRPLV